MRKSKEIERELQLLEDGQQKLYSEILLDIRNTLIQIHIDNNKHGVVAVDR